MRANIDSSVAKGLCQVLQRLLATFGVPKEISSDGGPEFIAQESKNFYLRWERSTASLQPIFPTLMVEQNWQ